MATIAGGIILAVFILLLLPAILTIASGLLVLAVAALALLAGYHGLSLAGVSDEFIKFWGLALFMSFAGYHWAKAMISIFVDVYNFFKLLPSEIRALWYWLFSQRKAS